ncbi:MAG: hypothetical protein LQ352_001984 [Teloschistes flavicans]|nr:MAG: hypothetical protein LQ352_001984 [Teloschistes flavicans]
MRGGVHDTFDPITIHTAKCDICNKHNTSTMFRCTKCGRQCCTPCWDRKGGDGRHNLHNKKTLEYKGPKAAPLPAVEVPKPAASQPTRQPARVVPERKRGRDKTVTEAAEGTSNASPAASATSSVSAREAEDSTLKRHRHDSIDNSATNPDDNNVEGKSTEVVENPWYLPTLGKSKGSSPEAAKDKNVEVGSPLLSSDLPPSRVLTELSQSATTQEVTTTAAGRDEHTTPSRDLSRDHDGLNTIVKAAGLLERRSSSSVSAATGTPPPLVAHPFATAVSTKMGPPSAPKFTMTQRSVLAHSPEGMKKMKKMLTPVPYDHTRNRKQTDDMALETMMTSAAPVHKRQKSNNEHAWDPASYAGTTTTYPPITSRALTSSSPSFTHGPSTYPRQMTPRSYDPRKDPTNPYAPPATQPKGERDFAHKMRTSHQKPRHSLSEAAYGEGSMRSPVNATGSTHEAAGVRRPRLGAGYAAGYAGGYASGQVGAGYTEGSAFTPINAPPHRPYLPRPAFLQGPHEGRHFSAQVDDWSRALPNPFRDLPVLKGNGLIGGNTGAGKSGRVLDGREVGRDERSAVPLSSYSRYRGSVGNMTTETGGYEDEDEGEEEEEGEFEEKDAYPPGPRR